MNYYDLVLGLIPVSVLGIGGSLFAAGVALPVSIAIGSVVAISLMAHGMFVRAPARTTVDRAVDAATTSVDRATEAASTSVDVATEAASTSVDVAAEGADDSGLTAPMSDDATAD